MLILWIKAFHIIFVVTWFAGIFYLPRLFVYHAESSDAISVARFKVMERRLYNGIMTPSGLIATLLGFALVAHDYQWYMQQDWMQAKLGLVALLWVYHLYCGQRVNVFRQDKNTYSPTFYRWFNEFPVFILVTVVILVVVKP